jgi:hypothetical protein
MRAKTSEKRQSTLVAIALAAYKPKPRFFSQQLQSLVDQTHQNWVCVITFDSSMREALKPKHKEVSERQAIRLAPKLPPTGSCQKF